MKRRIAKRNGGYPKSLGARALTAAQAPIALLPAYKTHLGSAYNADSRDVLAALPESSVDLIVTSPPYALHFKKEYGNVEKSSYVEWFLPFAREIYRVLKPEGSGMCQ
jgi:DNA modification methylase